MISTLPRWIEFGAFVLALVAGCVNAIGLLSFEHQAVSHVSGTATLLGVQLSLWHLATSIHLVGVLLAFMVGAAISGVLLHGAKLQLGRHYDTALTIEAILLLAALLLLSADVYAGVFLASIACGLQNALATTFSGAVVRTTHLTGIFTDLGIMLGGVLRGERLDRRKAKLFSLIIVGFIAGGMVGAFLHRKLHFLALFFPALVCLLLALLYRLLLRNPSANKRKVQ
ncbi:YoaK family protein [Teredinibacter turnerae]|uniref:YoaK family protein n=1 Tax=Teredinibacter turnerae TaxID=2426 RepID=UPI00035F99CC|nr:YoaK family protein [Teredinibacter turnerae]